MTAFIDFDLQPDVYVSTKRGLEAPVASWQFSCHSRLRSFFEELHLHYSSFSRLSSRRDCAAQRTQIIDAGLTAFAQYGPAATTAQICATAGIASGTFFHHFQTKDALVVAIIDLGMTETQEFFSSRQAAVPSLQVIIDFVDHSIEELEDTRAASLIQAIAGMVHRQPIAQALQAQQEAVQDALASVIGKAQESQLVREDIAAARLAAWVLLIVDGYTGAVANGTIDASKDAVLLHEQIRALLARRY